MKEPKGLPNIFIFRPCCWISFGSLFGLDCLLKTFQKQEWSCCAKGQLAPNTNAAEKNKFIGQSCCIKVFTHGKVDNSFAEWTLVKRREKELKLHTNLFMLAHGSSLLKQLWNRFPVLPHKDHNPRMVKMAPNFVFPSPKFNFPFVLIHVLLTKLAMCCATLQQKQTLGDSHPDPGFWLHVSSKCHMSEALMKL